MKRAPPSLRGQALALLSRREYSRQELRSRLLSHARRLAALQDDDASTLAAERHAAGADDASAVDAGLEAEVDAVLAWVVSQGFQSDDRFVESRVHLRASRQGLTRIRHELARHGVALDAATAEQLKASESSRARAIWQQRFGGVSDEPREQARQIRFLLARGFAPDVARRIVGGRDDDV